MNAGNLKQLYVIIFHLTSLQSKLPIEIHSSRQKLSEVFKVLQMYNLAQLLSILRVIYNILSLYK